nr:PREDICTED: protein FAM219A [Bos mutus]
MNLKHCEADNISESKQLNPDNLQLAGTGPEVEIGAVTGEQEVGLKNILVHQTVEAKTCVSAQSKDPAAASISDGDCDAREGESVAMNYKPSPLQVKLEKQRELARKGSLKNGSMGSPVNQQPKKNNVMARTRLVVPNKGYSSLDQSPDEKPLVALDTDSDDDFDMSRYSSSGYSSAEQINQDLNIQLLKDGYRLDEIPDDEDLDLIPPKSVNPTCMCCQATSSTACHIQ